MKKIERYQRFKLRRAIGGRLEYITVSALKSPTNGKHEITIQATYENGALLDGSARIIRIPKGARFSGRNKFIAEQTEKVIAHFTAQGFSVVNPAFVVW